MRKLTTVLCMSLAFVLLLGVAVFAKGGGSDPVNIGRDNYANRDWATYGDIKLAENSTEYFVKYPKYVGESVMLADLITPIYNPDSSTMPVTFTTSNSSSYTWTTGVEVTTSVGFSAGVEGFGVESSLSVTASVSHQTSSGTTTTIGITKNVPAYNTLYIYGKTTYIVETGKLVTYNAMSNDPNALKRLDNYRYARPVDFRVVPDYVSGEQNRPFANQQVGGGWGLISSAASKFQNAQGAFGGATNRVFVWSGFVNNDSNTKTSLCTYGLWYDWNLSGIHNVPSEHVTYMNNPGPFVPTEIIQENFYPRH